MYNEKSNDEEKRIILTMWNNRIEKEERRKLERKGLWPPNEIKQKIRPRIGDRLVELMLEDDRDMKKRLLRPLVLFHNNEENQQLKGLYSDLPSWKTNIKNINSCQIFVVLEEAIVLNNPIYIKNGRHSKSHELKDITYVLLLDNTGVIALIEDDENL